MLEACPTKL